MKVSRAAPTKAALVSRGWEEIPSCSREPGREAIERTLLSIRRHVGLHDCSINRQGTTKRHHERIVVPLFLAPTLSSKKPVHTNKSMRSETTVSSLTHRMALALLAVLQNSLVGGLVYGWASIDRTLLVKDANLDFDQTTSIFSYATSIGMFSSLFMGPVLDVYGPRKCSIIAHSIVGIGCAIFATADSYAGFLIATVLITFGGPGIQLSIVHLCNLFPANQYLALSTINGSISFSFDVFAAFAAIWESTEISFRTLFGLHAGIIFVSLVVSWLVWPDETYEMPPAPKDYHKPSLEEQLVEAATAHRHILAEQSFDSFLREGEKRELLKHHSFMESKRALAIGDELLVNLKDMPFWKQFSSGTYIRAVVTFVTTCFLANFYVASISTELADIQEFTTVEQHGLTQTFTLIMSSGIAAAVVIGILMDQVGLEVCSALTLVLGQIQLIVLVWFAFSKFVLVASFVCYMLFRSFLFPVFIASLTTHLGYKYFGILNGIGFACSGLAQSSMSHLVRAVQGDCHVQMNVTDVDAAAPCDHGHWVTLHCVQLGVLTVLLVAPLLDYVEGVMRKRQLRQVLGSLRSLSFQMSGSPPQYGSFSSARSEEGPGNDGDDHSEPGGDDDDDDIGMKL